MSAPGRGAGEPRLLVKVVRDATLDKAQYSALKHRANSRFVRRFLCQSPAAEGQPGRSLILDTMAPTVRTGRRMTGMLGGLWANLSQGHRRFMIAKDKCWDDIEPLLT